MKMFCLFVLVSALAVPAGAEVLVYKSVETTSLMGTIGTNAYKITLPLKGYLVLDKDTATAAYIARATYKGQSIYFKYEDISWNYNQIVYRKLRTRDLSYIFMDLNYIRFQSDTASGLVFRDLAKGTPYNLGLKLIPEDPSPFVFPKSFRGQYRELMNHPWGPYFSFEGKTLYVFMTQDTQGANARNATSSSYIEEVESSLKAAGYREISDLEDVLSLVP